MLGRLRPIAALISRVSRMPDAPTRVPATMSRFDPSVNPDAATARPVKELSSEINTGTSAPPIGRTKTMPRMKARARRIHSNGSEPVARMVTISASAASPTTPLISCWPG